MSPLFLAGGERDWDRLTLYPKLCRSYFYLKIFVWKKRQRIEKIKKSKIKKSRIRQTYSGNTPVLPLLPVLPHVDLCEKKALIII